MQVLRAFVLLLLLTRILPAGQPTPILPDPKLTPGDTFDVTAQDVCVPGYAKKVRDVPVWVNTRSGKYWKPSPRYYGKTREGEFMPELDALGSRVYSRTRNRPIE